MGHKVHPTGFRLGVIRDWQSKWYSDTHYAEYAQEDVKLREAIQSKYREAAISLVEIHRQAKDVTLTLHTARPGIVIGRGGARVDEMRLLLEALIGKRIRLNIQEVRQPELDAYLVGRAIAEQIERRVAYRRAMKQAIFRTIQAGAKGIKVSCSGRLGNAEIARRQTMHEGRVPLHTLRADVDYGFTEAHTTLGRIGIKVWIYKGEILPEPKVVAFDEGAAETEPEVAAVAETEPVAAVIEPAKAEVAPSMEAAPAAVVEEPVEVPAEAETVASVETPPAAEAEKKPAKPRARATKKTAAAVEPAEAEEKPAKPARSRAKAAATPEAEPSAAEPAAAEIEEVEPTASTETEEKDATA